MTTKLLAGRVTDIKVSALIPDPNNPRRSFDDDSLKELASSVKDQGILQPIVAREVDGKLMIVMGERRWRAAKLAGLKVVPVILGNGENKDDVNRGVRQILENTARESLSPLDVAAYLDELRTRQKKTPNELVRALQERGLKDAGFLKVQQLLELVKLPDWAKDYLRAGKISEAGALQIVQLLKWPAIVEAAKQEVDQSIKWRGNLSASETRELATSAIRRGGKNLDDKWSSDAPAFPTTVCKGCEFLVKRSNQRYCMNPAEFDKKQSEALQLLTEKQKADEQKAAARKADGKMTKAEQEKMDYREKRTVEIKGDKLAEYLDKWLRAKLQVMAPQRLPMAHVHSVALWMACIAPSAAPRESLNDFYYGADQRQGDAARETSSFMRKFKLGDLPTFLDLGTKLGAQHWHEMLAAAIRTMTRDQVRSLAHAIKLDLRAAGYVIDMDYLNLQRKAQLLQLAKQGGVEDASGTMSQLKAKILKDVSAQRIGVPSELEKTYRKASKPREDIELLALAEEVGEPPTVDADDVAQLGKAASANVPAKAAKTKRKR